MNFFIQTMQRVAVMGLALTLAASPVAASSFCDSVRAVAAMAPGGYEMIAGDFTQPDSSSNSTQRRGTYRIEGSDGCVINNEREYWCDFSNTDPNALADKVSACFPEASSPEPGGYKLPSGTIVTVNSWDDEVWLTIDRP